MNVAIRLTADGRLLVSEVQAGAEALRGLGDAATMHGGRAQQALSGVSSGAANAAASLGGISQAAGIAFQAYAAVRFTGALYEMARAAAEVQAAIDKVNIGLKLINGGNVAEASRDMDFLRAEAARLGVSLDGAAQSYIRIAAASRETALEGASVKEFFSAMAEASTALGLSSEESSGAMTAVVQMISKGKVGAEELTGQLGESLPGALQIAARAMGKTTAELFKMMEQGELLSAEFLPKFAKQLHSELGGASEEASKSAQASLNRLDSAWADLKKGIAQSGVGEAATGQLNILADGLAGVTQQLRQARAEGAGFWGQMGAIVKGAAGFLNPINAVNYTAQADQSRLAQAIKERDALRLTANEKDFYAYSNVRLLNAEIDKLQSKLKSSAGQADVRAVDNSIARAAEIAQKDAQARTQKYLTDGKGLTSSEKLARTLDDLKSDFAAQTKGLDTASGLYQQAKSAYEARVKEAQDKAGKAGASKALSAAKQAGDILVSQYEADAGRQRLILESQVADAQSAVRQRLITEEEGVQRVTALKAAEVQAKMVAEAKASEASGLGKEQRAKHLQAYLTEHQRYVNTLADGERQLADIRARVAREDEERRDRYLTGEAQKAQTLADDTAATYLQIDALLRQDGAITSVKTRLEELELARLNDALASTRQQEAAQAALGLSEAQRQSFAGTISALEQMVDAKRRLVDAGRENDAAKAAETLAKGIQDNDPFRGWGSGLREVFGTASDGLARMVDGVGALTKAQKDAENAQQVINALRAQGGEGAAKAAQLEEAVSKRAASAQISAYASITGAAKLFFKEGSTGYKTLQAAETAFRAVELATAIQSFVTKSGLLAALTAQKATSDATMAASDTARAGVEDGNTVISTGLKAVKAVVNAIASMPFPLNLAAGAATAAAIGALGVAVMGGGGSSGASVSAEQRQADQGTGTVLGDSKAKSESIAKSMEALSSMAAPQLRYTSQMASSLRNIESGIAGLAAAVLRGTGIASGGGFGITEGTVRNGIGPLNGVLSAVSGVASMVPIVGGLVSGLIDKVFGGFSKTSTSIKDSGIEISPGTLGQLAGGRGMRQYANVQVEESSWWGLSKSSRASELAQSLNADLSKQLSMVFGGIDAGIRAAAVPLGVSTAKLTAGLQSAVVDIGKVSLKGLSGEEVQKALEGAFSKAADQVAKAVLPGLDAFQKVGEGYFQTATRVSSGVESARAALLKFGIGAVAFTDVVNKQGDVAAEILRQSVVQAETTRATVSGVGQIVETLFGAVQDIADAYGKLLDTRKLLEQSGLSGAALSADMLMGAGGLDALQSAVQKYADAFMTPAERVGAMSRQLGGEFAKLGLAMPTSRDGFKALVASIDTGTGAGQKLLGQVLSLADGFDSLQSTLDKSEEKARAVATERAGLERKLLDVQGDTAAIRAQELDKLDASNRALQEQVWALEDQKKAADAAASAAKALAQTMFGAAKALRDAAGKADTDALSPEAKFAELQGKYAQAFAMATVSSGGELADRAETMRNLLAPLLEAGKSMYGSSEAFQSLLQQTTRQARWVADKLDGTLPQHADGLGWVPYDGYTAQLHEGEAVIDARTMASLRKYGLASKAVAPAQAAPADNSETLAALREQNNTLRTLLAHQAAANQASIKELAAMREDLRRMRKSADREAASA